MDWDEPFPLNAVPPRVRNTILNEFKGRCPNIREVAEIPDSYWLATPSIGPTFLEQIRSVTDAALQQTASPSRPQLTDAELLDRLERLQDELRWLQDQMEAKLLRLQGADRIARRLLRTQATTPDLLHAASSATYALQGCTD